jgi:hypothetical protein
LEKSSITLLKFGVQNFDPILRCINFKLYVWLVQIVSCFLNIFEFCHKVPEVLEFVIWKWKWSMEAPGIWWFKDKLMIWEWLIWCYPEKATKLSTVLVITFFYQRQHLEKHSIYSPLHVYRKQATYSRYSKYYDHIPSNNITPIQPSNPPKKWKKKHKKSESVEMTSQSLQYLNSTLDFIQKIPPHSNVKIKVSKIEFP